MRRQPPRALDDLPLSALPCSPVQCNHCGKNFSRKSSLSKHILAVHGASCPSKIVAKLMACRRIKTWFSFKEHMKSGTHLLKTELASVKGIYVGGVHAVSGW